MTSQTIYYLYPLLLCTLPVHAIFAQNMKEVESKNYVHSLLIVCAITIAGIFGVNKLVHNMFLAELIFCTVFFLLLYCNNIYLYCVSRFLWKEKNTYIPFKILYLILSIAAGLGVYYIFHTVNLLILSKVLFYFSAFVIITMLANNLNNTKTSVEISLPENLIESTKDKNLPDIYHIVLDCHIGFDKEGYKDSYFFEELEKQGFCNITKFKSNYNLTHLSMPSILNMEHIPVLLNKDKTDFYPESVTFSYYSNNKLWKILEQLNYEINLTVNPMFNKIVQNSQIKTNNYFLKGINANLRLLCFSSFFSFLLIPLKKSFKIFEDQFELYKSFCENNKNNTGRIYNFMHILAPHGPLLFDENGQKFSRKQSNDFKNYYSFLKYTDKKVLELIDTIKQNMKPNSVIIIHGDHGLQKPLDSRFKTLCSIYYPDKDYNKFPAKLTGVNLFRCVLNKFFGTKMEHKPDLYFATDIISKNIIHEIDINNTQQQNSDFNPCDYKKIYDVLCKKYKNKKVVLYGAGKFFEFIKDNFDLSKFNIIAVSDLKFNEFDSPKHLENIGFKVITPHKIHTLKPDIVIICTEKLIPIMKYFKEELFKNTGKRFKYTSFVNSSKAYKELQTIEWAKVLFP